MKRKRIALLWLSGLALAALSAGTLAAAKYPPALRWLEIEGKGITVIFPAGRSIEAQAALKAAAALNCDLASFWGMRLPGRIRIVLSDSSDDANGFATFYPFNLVGADLAEPPPDSELAGSRGLLDLVLAHEMTHLFTMNAGAPIFRLARRLFGSQPVFYPAVQLPPWVVEGLAVEGESRLTGDGRLNHPPYRLMLSAARRDGVFPSWNGIAGMPAAWPGPNGKYLFGAGFMEFLADRYGRDSLRRYLERFTSRLVSFASSRDFKKTFGAPLGKLWDDYRDHVPVAGESAPVPLTKNGFLQQYPCPLGEDRLLYYRRDYQSRGEVVVLDLKTGHDKPLFKMDAVNGLHCPEKEGRILFSALDHFHAFSEFSDLYEYDLKKGRLRRLSRGLRLMHPVGKGNADEIDCVQRSGGSYHLARFDARLGSARRLSRSFAGMAQPSPSPDCTRIAAAVKLEGGPWGIGLFAGNGEMQALISLVHSDLSQPRWQDNERLFFIVSGKETSRLASLALDGSMGRVCDDPRLAGLRQFDLSPDGREVFFSYFSGRGQELSRLSLENLTYSPMELTVTSGIPEAKTAAPVLPSRPYRPLRDLLPRWWSPALRQGGDEIQTGIMTGGQDALGIHSYSLEGYYGLSSHRPNLLLRYVYDGLFPTLALSYQDTTTYYGYSERTREMKLASIWPLRLRRRSQFYGYVDLHLEKHSAELTAGAQNYAGSYNGFRLGLVFNSSREFHDSISPSDGACLTLQCSIQPSGLGNKWASRSIQADLRHYIPLFRPGVLALRLAAARSWEAGRFFYDMGGLLANNSLGNDRPFTLLRGFFSEYCVGDRGWQVNAEYRLPLFRIEKAILPAVSLDRIWLTPFFDMGRLHYSYREYELPVVYSIGSEIVLRLAFGGAMATDLAFGVAHGFGPEKQWRIYLRTGRSF